MKNTTPGLDLKHSRLLMFKMKGENGNLGLLETSVTPDSKTYGSCLRLELERVSSVSPSPLGLLSIEPCPVPTKGAICMLNKGLASEGGTLCQPYTGGLPPVQGCCWVSLHLCQVSTSAPRGSQPK